MKVSELISGLEAFRREHGDLNVKVLVHTFDDDREVDVPGVSLLHMFAGRLSLEEVEERGLDWFEVFDDRSKVYDRNNGKTHRVEARAVLDLPGHF